MKLIIPVALWWGVFSSVIFAVSGEHGGTPLKKNQKVAANPSKAIEVGNRICPVSGEEIPIDKEVKEEYKGKIYNFCCKMCLKDFRKEPQKYIDMIEKGQKELPKKSKL